VRIRPSIWQTWAKKEIPEMLYSLIKNRKLGRKTGEGFYRRENNRPVRESANIKRKVAKEVTESEI